ncbi:MAG: wax ester/triacylglycerol synthase family O-acyltransferase [Acidimicrobiales bacterium]|jgi:WS/DGAT/MGAT family acyltransferase|nr:wax ester/triacylglycerol synthase family O-acyltransferase [Acidimicrobiales bacterium]
MSGADATFVHLERMGEPCHTLKVMVLDTSERGYPVTLREMRAAISAHLPGYPRARQRVVVPPLFKSLPFWVDDPDFDLDLHLSERALPAPGTRRQLDDVCSSLASDRLDLARPLWDATLVHGLEGGEQAVVFRLHHALSDGMGVVRLFEQITTDAPGPGVPSPRDDWRPAPLPSGRELVTSVVAGVPGRLGAAGEMVRWEWRNRATVLGERRTFARRDDLVPSGLSVPYTWMNPRFGTRRLCASSSLPLADFRFVKERVGTSLNSVLLAVLAGAIRAESAARGLDVDHDAVCALGVAIDPPGSERLYGNNISNMYVSLHTSEADPLERLGKVSRSASDTVALRREALDGRPHTFSDLTPRLGPALGELLAYRVKRTAANLAAGNVPGPATTRYLGDVRVSDLVSYAVVVLNAGLELTVYSYDGAMKFGLLVAPEVHRHPHEFLDRIADSLAELMDVSRGLPARVVT